ncbi:MAG: 30S ribosomal protein S4 [Candidatus Hadarchaeales archaeon]
MRRQRRKYIKPAHPWEKERMDHEDKILSQFGLRRKREIWRAQTVLRGFRRQARRLLAESGPQAERETKQLISRLHKLGLVEKDATLDDALGLTVEKILERYLQMVIYRRGLAKSPREARQMILHGKVTIGERKIDVPSYMVPIEEEPLIKVVGAEGEKPAAGGEEQNV